MNVLFLSPDYDFYKVYSVLVFNDFLLFFYLFIEAGLNEISFHNKLLSSKVSFVLVAHSVPIAAPI